MDINNFIQRTITGLVLGLGFWIALVYAPAFIFSGILLAILLIILITEWCNFFTITSPLFWLVMPFYPILPFALLIYLNHNPIYHHLLLVLFIIVSSLDTGSYLIGSALGYHRIWPNVSPNKSWEGFFGGYLIACIWLTLLLYEFNNMQPWWVIMGFTFIVSILALAGDLFESWLKRRVQLKDSGCLLPGHGGFLDRFDGILFAVFFFYLFRDSLINIFNF